VDIGSVFQLIKAAVQILMGPEHFCSWLKSVRWEANGGLPGALGICPYGVEVEDVGLMTGIFPGGARGTPDASGDDGPCPVNC